MSQQWRDIASAPRPPFDGEILAYGGSAGGGVPTFWCAVVHRHRGAGSWMRGDDVVFFPTHWQPLPEPPESQPSAFSDDASRNLK